MDDGLESKQNSQSTTERVPADIELIQCDHATLDAFPNPMEIAHHSGQDAAVPTQLPFVLIVIVKGTAGRFNGLWADTVLLRVIHCGGVVDPDWKWNHRGICQEIWILNLDGAY